MSRRTANDVPEPGYDSFLDIVANLVGILVILIMVVGVQAQERMGTVDRPTTEAGIGGRSEQAHSPAQIARGRGGGIEIGK